MINRTARATPIKVDRLQSMGYEPIIQSPYKPVATPIISDIPIKNIYTRCPLVQVWNTNSDSLRQVYSTIFPQRRIFIGS